MKSKQNYFLIFFFVYSFFCHGQNPIDTIPTPQNIPTAKGVSLETSLPFEEMTSSSKVVTKSQPVIAESKKEIPALTVQNPVTKKSSTPIDELQFFLEKDLERITKELSTIGLAYRQQRILKIKKEELQQSNF